MTDTPRHEFVRKLLSDRPPGAGVTFPSDEERLKALQRRTRSTSSSIEVQSRELSATEARYQQVTARTLSNARSRSKHVRFDTLLTIVHCCDRGEDVFDYIRFSALEEHYAAELDVWAQEHEVAAVTPGGVSRGSGEADSTHEDRATDETGGEDAANAWAPGSRSNAPLDDPQPGTGVASSSWHDPDGVPAWLISIDLIGFSRHEDEDVQHRLKTSLLDAAETHGLGGNDENTRATFLGDEVRTAVREPCDTQSLVRSVVSILRTLQQEEAHVPPEARAIIVGSGIVETVTVNAIEFSYLDGELPERLESWAAASDRPGLWQVAVPAACAADVRAVIPGVEGELRWLGDDLAFVFSAAGGRTS